MALNIRLLGLLHSRDWHKNDQCIMLSLSCMVRQMHINYFGNNLNPNLLYFRRRRHFKNHGQYKADVYRVKVLVLVCVTYVYRTIWVWMDITNLCAFGAPYSWNNDKYSLSGLSISFQPSGECPRVEKIFSSLRNAQHFTMATELYSDRF